VAPNDRPPRKHFILQEEDVMTTSNGNPRTLYDKIWDDHVVEKNDDGNTILYIDRHLVHEVTSPQAF